jgi:hypothetical protein
LNKHGTPRYALVFACNSFVALLVSTVILVVSTAHQATVSDYYTVASVQSCAVAVLVPMVHFVNRRRWTQSSLDTYAQLQEDVRLDGELLEITEGVEKDKCSHADRQIAETLVEGTKDTMVGKH